MGLNFLFILKSLYWICVYLFLTYMSYKNINSLWMAYLSGSLSFTVDTLYLNWNTSFPAVSICEIFNGEKNYDLNEKHFGTDRDKNLDDLIASISFFSGNCYNCKACITDPGCPTNFSDILRKFRSDCTQMIQNCYWNDEQFNCCDAFLKLKTEFGTCYTINSAFTNPPFAMQLMSNRRDGPGNLHFELFEDSQIHIHPPYDIPFLNEEKNLKENVLWGSIKEIILSVNEIANDENVKSVLINQRRCRFPFEVEHDKDIRLFDIYSYSGCIVECHSRIQMELCNCTNHLMPITIHGYQTFCDYNGLVCLTDHYTEIVDRRTNCECIESCEEPEYNIIYSSNEDYREEDGSLVKISLMNLPTERYIRKVVRTKLDLIISIGGIAGLYYGASIITFIDLFYHGTKKLSFICKTMIRIFKKKFALKK